MSELKACPRCNGAPYIIRAHGAKWVACRCGIQSSRYGEHIDDVRMIADWNRRPLEDGLSKRIAELERTVDDLRGDLVQSDRASDNARIAELEDEHDKLRAAMENIIPNCMPEDEDDAAAWAACILRIAQEALKGAKS